MATMDSYGSMLYHPLFMGGMEEQVPDRPHFLPPVITMTTSAGYAPSLHRKDEKNYPPLRLGPIARSHTLIDGRAPPSNFLPRLQNGTDQSSGGVRYPRIIVKDPAGRTLDTFTTLQEAIYRASWQRKKMGEWPKTPFEWRLPKAPVPSKPDFTRAAPRSMTSLHLDLSLPRHQNMTSPSHDVTGTTRRLDLTTEMLVNIPTVEIPVEDVAFVQESLNHLPNLPSFSFLRHSILAGQSTYVQIVASILLHQRQLRARDQRESDWEFPGFCTGCKRAGFCYGCSKNPKPHVHEDIPARTGGGFRYWKRDRPRDPHIWKHPGNWRLPSTEEELRDIIEKYGGLSAYEQAVFRARRKMERAGNDVMGQVTSEDGAERLPRLQRLTNLSTYPPYVTIISTDDFGDGKIDEEDMGVYDKYDDGDDFDQEEEKEKRTRRISRRRTREEEGGRRERKTAISSVKEKEEEEEEFSSEYESEEESDESMDRTLVRVDTGYFEEMSEVEERRAKVSIVDPKEEEEGKEGSAEKERGRHVSRAQTNSTHSEASHSPNRGVGAAGRSRKTSRLDFTDKSREFEEEEEARLRREPPKFFTVQKRARKITVAKDPFSTERDLKVPTGGTFQLKKSERKATEFVEFKRGDRGWKAPKKFEVKHGGKEDAKFGTGRSHAGDGKRRGRRGDGDSDDDESRRRRRKDVSPDSGVDSGTAGGREESAKDAGGEDAGKSAHDNDGKKDGEDKDKLKGAGEGEDDKGGVGGEDDAASRKPKRREIVKKTRVEKVVLTPPQTPPRPPSPPIFKRRQSPVATPTPPRSPTPEEKERPLPELDLPVVPDLPDIEDKSPEKRKQKQKFVVEAPPTGPQLKEEPKKRRGPPKVRIIPKNLSRPRKSRPAEAPVTSEELMDIQDPLDFLAKWCIINPDRLPFYEIVFESTVTDQTPRYNQPQTTQPEGEKKKEGENNGEVKDENEESDGKKKKKGKSKKKKSSKDKEKKQEELNPSLLPTERGMNVEKVAMTVEEQHLEKLIYTLDMLQDKMMNLGDELDYLEAKRLRLMAHKARESYPEVASPDYSPKKKKGKKGKKKEKQSAEPARRLRPDEITDEVIVQRLEDKMLKEICKDSDVKYVEAETQILKQKIREVQGRVEEIAREKLLADAFCMNHFFMRQGLQNSDSDNFKRQQSELYNRLHPSPDFEMNLEEVEEALQQINNHLLTEKEFYFLYSVLNLPGRKKINFRLFTVIAALSEKVTQLDPVIRKLINNFNYNALDIKMEKCKELFDLLDADHMPRGGAQAASLAVELTAGGLRPEHTKYVLNKFNRESKGVIDFLDFVTYVPLFVEIHKRIIQDPLKQDLDL